MKNYRWVFSVIFIILLVVLVIIVGIKVSSKKSVNLQIIIVTKSEMTINEVEEIIIDSLEGSDPKIKVDVRKSSDEVVTLANNFVGTLNTTLNNDEIIKMLTKSKRFKHVQQNYIFKIQN
ncbi:hypothetical protein LGK95_08565 [Clostridium algoriphilum]|uniref:hypothetical protein n=1 Tax=Clostridium algoriphilum TaxID=198347 RepID=UPI001CF31A17|nr:hypothetical protein [Clostridium algoriphilum]MCB2293573.1 hypothetical protein [Clostridium algoriphilum]